MKEVLEYLKAIAVAIVIAMVVRRYFYDAYRVQVAPGRIGGVCPSLVNGQHVFTNKVFYRLFTPSRGDFVNLRLDGEVRMSRVVAYPGEHVRLAEGRLYIDGQALEEPYLVDEGNAKKGVLVDRVLHGYLMLGDNRGERATAQDKYLMEVPLEDIDSRIFFVFSFWQCGPDVRRCFGVLQPPDYNIQRPPQLKYDLDSEAARALLSL